MAETVQRWLKRGQHLPRFMRDFHDQKDVFKCVSLTLENYKNDAPEYHRAIKAMSWADLHMVTIDVFLWWMAQRGYTLQRSRARLPFRDVSDDIKERERAETTCFRSVIGKPKDGADHG